MDFNYGRFARLFSTLALLCFSVSNVVAGDVVSLKAQDIFATVNGEVISTAEFHAFLMEGAQQRFYHGKTTSKEQTAFREEMGQKIVDRVLLLQEAQKRNIVVKEISIEKGGQQHVAHLKEDAVLDRLRVVVGERVSANEQEVEAYYSSNPEKFTRPEQIRVSLILLAVPPYATPATWQDRMTEAEAIAKKIEAGEPFSSLAIQYSDHQSSKAGGDLGFVHSGMLTPEVEQLIKGLSVGENAAPIYLLQGVAMFRLVERVAAKLNSYNNVASRARDLLLRERRDQAWSALLVQLRATANIHME
ncbi:MAG: hypothetical protein GXP14_15320 [Gammaproteobacteria bacterium]|nr:hypothetical protein [Gammaproteobacteria bacterium]